MLRILYSGFGYGQGESGLAEYIHSTASLLAARGYQVDLLMQECDVQYYLEKHDNINIIPLTFKGSRLQLQLKHFFLVPLKIDLSNYDLCLLPAGEQMMLGRFPIPAIAVVHDFASHLRHSLLSWPERFWLKKVIPQSLLKTDYVIALSENARDEVIRLSGISRNRVAVNYCGFNVADFYSSPGNDDNTSDRINSLPDQYILYNADVGSSHQNHITLIKAYQKLPDRLKAKHKLVLTGQILPSGRKLVKYVKRSSDKDNIIFTGHIKKENMPEVFRRACIYAVPSYHEGYGIPLAEAMSCGVPVVCSNSSALPEIGGNAVITFDPDSSVELYRHLEELLMNSALREEMIKEGYRQKEKFNWNHHVDRLIEIIDLVTSFRD